MCRSVCGRLPHSAGTQCQFLQGRHGWFQTTSSVRVLNCQDKQHKACTVPGVGHDTSRGSQGTGSDAPCCLAPLPFVEAWLPKGNQPGCLGPPTRELPTVPVRELPVVCVTQHQACVKHVLHDTAQHSTALHSTASSASATSCLYNNSCAGT
jgi:hypothetical protein